MWRVRGPDSHTAMFAEPLATLLRVSAWLTLRTITNGFQVKLCPFPSGFDPLDIEGVRSSSRLPALEATSECLQRLVQ